MAEKQLIVVGAGASAELGLPVGSGLKDEICRKLRFRSSPRHGWNPSEGDEEIYRALAAHARTLNPPPSITNFFEAAEVIADAMPHTLSIDNFIDSHRGNEQIELCGKLAIVRTILEAERKSKVYIDSMHGANYINFGLLGDTWYNRFMQLLTENCHEDDLQSRLENFVFVVFNYDRCIEHFLYHALQNFYRLSPERAASLVDGLAILHPFGLVGSLPWQNPEEVGVDFGAEVGAVELLRLTKQIKTFSESPGPSSDVGEEISDSLRACKILVFLGFAYHRLNMSLLGDFWSSVQFKRCYGTASGISRPDAALVTEELVHRTNLSNEQIMLSIDHTCFDFYGEYQRSLSVA